MTAKRASAARDKILQAAYELFYQQGYQATTVDQVIEKSGVSKPTVYSHFPTKEDLCVEYLKERRRREVDLLKDALRRKNTPEERFVGLMKHIRKRILDSNYRGCGFFNMVCEIPDPANPIVSEAKIYIDAVREVIRDLVKEVRDSDPKYKKLDVEQTTNSYYLIAAGAIMASQEYRESWAADQAVGDVERLLER